MYNFVSIWPHFFSHSSFSTNFAQQQVVSTQAGFPFLKSSGLCSQQLIWYGTCGVPVMENLRVIWRYVIICHEDFCSFGFRCHVDSPGRSFCDGILPFSFIHSTFSRQYPDSLQNHPSQTWKTQTWVTHVTHTRTHANVTFYLARCGLDSLICQRLTDEGKPPGNDPSPGTSSSQALVGRLGHGSGGVRI